VDVDVGALASDRGPAPDRGDGVREAPVGIEVVIGQVVVADDVSGLADADPGGGIDEGREHLTSG